MKIVISSNTMWSVANFRSRLIDSLIERGHEVTVLAPWDKHAARLAHPGCKTVDLHIDSQGANPARELALLGRYLRVLASEQPAVYLGFTVKPNVYGALAAQMLGIPVINNITGLGRAFIRRGFVNRIVQLLYRLSLRRSRVVFFQNEEDRKLFLDLGLVKKAQVDLLPGSGVDLTHFMPRDASTTEARSGQGGQEFCFLMLARLLRDKGVEEYAEAARIVHRRFPRVRCVLLGHIDENNPNTIPRERIRQWEGERLIQYIADTADVRPLLAQADCVVLPSYYREGVPRSLLEAAAMARPVITTDSVGCRDAVTDGVSGFLCKPRDADDLALKMIEMVSMEPERRREMGAAGRRKMELTFDDRIVIARTINAIERCLDGEASVAPSRKLQPIERERP